MDTATIANLRARLETANALQTKIDRLEMELPEIKKRTGLVCGVEEQLSQDVSRVTKLSNHYGLEVQQIVANALSDMRKIVVERLKLRIIELRKEFKEL